MKRSLKVVVCPRTEPQPCHLPGLTQLTYVTVRFGREPQGVIVAPHAELEGTWGMFLMVPYVPGSLGLQQPHFSRSSFHPSTLPPVERPRWLPLLHLQRPQDLA